METRIGITYTDVHVNGHLNGNGYNKGIWKNILPSVPSDQKVKEVKLRENFVSVSVATWAYLTNKENKHNWSKNPSMEE